MNRRKRCPFCSELTSSLRKHIIGYHFPVKCSKCDKSPVSHKRTKTLGLIVVCEGGHFMTDEPR